MSILGITHHQKNYRSLFPIATFYMTITWLFVKWIFPVAYALGQKLASNPYFETSALDVAKFIVRIPLILALPFLGVAARTLTIMQRTDPIYKDRQEEITVKRIVIQTQKQLREMKKKIGRLQQIWWSEQVGINQSISMPMTTKLKQSYNLLFTKSPLENQELAICRDYKTQEIVTLPFKNVFQHFLIVGPTGFGKTMGIIEPVVWQVIKHILEGRRIGLTVVEPKGDLVANIASWCDKLGIPYTRIDPLLGEKSKKFNPLQGELYTAAEGTRAVMRKMFGRQEAFFGLVQEMAARNTILLLKRIKGDNLDLNTVRRALRSRDKLATYVDMLEKQVGPDDDLVKYFREEVLGTLRDKFQQFAMGLRLQFEDLMGNEMLAKVITGNSDINFDEHLDQGGILLVNTAMGALGKLGDAFGTFMIMHLQNAVFRRPGTPETRTPHFLLIDEAPRYINPDFERLLAIGRSYRCACFLATQTLAQLEMEEKKAFTNVVMSNCQNKIVFGGINKDDALYFEKEFGQVEKIYTRATYKGIFTPQIFPETYQNMKVIEPRFSYSKITELKDHRFIYRFVRGGGVDEPSIGEGLIVDPEVDFAPYLKKQKKKKKRAVENEQQQHSASSPLAEQEEGFVFISAQEPTPEPAPISPQATASEPGTRFVPATKAETLPKEPKEPTFTDTVPISMDEFDEDETAPVPEPDEAPGPPAETECGEEEDLWNI